MSFIKHIMDYVDSEIIWTAASMGIVTTSILVHNFIKVWTTPPLPTKKVLPTTLKAALKMMAGQKKKAKALKTKLLNFDSVLKNLNFKYKHINSISTYNKEYAKALNEYKRNRKLCFLLDTKLNSTKFNALLNLKSYKRLLASQNVLLKKLTVAPQWFFLHDYGPSVFYPFLFILVVYFLVAHWNVARYIVLLFFAGHTVSVWFLWKYFMYDAKKSFWVNFLALLRIFVWPILRGWEGIITS